MRKIIFCSALFISATLTATVAAQSVRNMNTVISGKLSRSGSSNRSALNDSALRELCEQGYTLAIFTYNGARARTVSCGGGRSIKYTSAGWSNPSTIISKASSEIRNGGKVLVHCWYGVHASNFATAAVLTKMCGFSGAQAAEYFRDRVPSGSLAQSRINELANRLSSLSRGGGVTGGCPSP